MTEQSQGQGLRESKDSVEPKGAGATNPPQALRPRRHWGRIVAIALIVLSGPALWFGVRPFFAVYTVEVTEVRTWRAYFKQPYPAGTQADFVLHNPCGHETAYAEVFLERFADDYGKDLLIREVPLGSSEGQCRAYDYFIAFNGVVSNNGVSSNKGGGGSLTKIQFSINSPVSATEGAVTAGVAGKAVVTTGGGLWRRRIVLPFEATVPISRDKYPLATGPPLTPVPDSAWGPKGDGKAEDIFRLSGMASRIPFGTTGELSADFRIRNLDPRTLASYTVTLTACYDNTGKKLLGDQPARTGVSEHWNVFGNGVWTAQDQRIMPAFCVKTNRMPASSAVSVTYEGTVKLKLGDGEESVVLEGIQLDPNKSLRIGPVELRPGRPHCDTVILGFWTRGDQGMLRQLIVENDYGAPPSSDAFGPTPFWTHSGWLDFPMNCGVGAVTIKAKYLTRQWHYDLPFKITVPLNANGWTVMKPAPVNEPTTSSRPAGG